MQLLSQNRLLSVQFMGANNNALNGRKSDNSKQLRVWNRKHDETHIINVAYNVSAADQWQHGYKLFPE